MVLDRLGWAAAAALTLGGAACNNSDRKDSRGEPGASASSALRTSTGSEQMTGAAARPARQAQGPCGLKQAAFCDPFDKPSPGGRGGDLDDRQWSAARISGINNIGQGQYNLWGATTTEACGKVTKKVSVPNDMFFCSGGPTASMRFNDSYDDVGGFTVHSVRVRQPFDFKGRTGTIAFDVGGKGATPGGHGFWFNIFIADEPVPAPYQAGQGIALYARAGLGLEFESQCSRDLSSNTVSNIFVEKNYEIVDAHKASDTPCFATKEDVLNHMEIRVSETSVEIWASDAGKPETMRKIYGHNGLNLGFSRGYVSLQHTHYNAAKCSFTTTSCEDCDNPACPTLPSKTTYHWDNVGFDGPVLPVPRSYEIPDAMVRGKAPVPDDHPNHPGPYLNLGYFLGVEQGGKDSLVQTIKGVDLTGAKSAAITLNAWEACSPTTLDYRFNDGAWRSFKLPFPDCDHAARAVLMPVTLSDLKNGNNKIEMYANRRGGPDLGVIVSNAELLIAAE